MSIICVEDLPSHWSISFVMKQLEERIKGQFVPINCTTNETGEKTFHLRLEPGLDGAQVVDTITNDKYHKYTWKAYVLDEKRSNNGTTSPTGSDQTPTKQNQNETELKETMNVKFVHSAVMVEMQSRLPGLYELSKKSDHELMKILSERVYNRLMELHESDPQLVQDCHTLSKKYRELYPQSSDYELVMMVQHDLDDASGLPLTQLSNEAISATTTLQIDTDNEITLEISKQSGLYAETLAKEMIKHIDELNVKPNTEDNEEEIARKKVRTELKSMSATIPLIFRKLIKSQFVFGTKMCLYGDPSLPKLEVVKQFLLCFKAKSVVRSKHMYNLVRFRIHSSYLNDTIAANGTVLFGMKLYIQPESLPQYSLEGKQ